MYYEMARDTIVNSIMSRLLEPIFRDTKFRYMYTSNLNSLHLIKPLKGLQEAIEVNYKTFDQKRCYFNL